MSLVNAKIKVQEDIAGLSRALSRDFVNRVKSKTFLTNSRISQGLTLIVSRALNTSPTVNSLLSGSLRDDFGLTSGEATAAVERIIEFLSQNVRLSAVNTNPTTVNISIRFLPGNFRSITRISEGRYIADGGPVNWLEWLLSKGTQVVVGDFSLFGNARGRTRSGGSSIMIQSDTGEPFRVDPRHAGTLNNNFITRAINPTLPEIADLIVEQLERSI